MTWDEAIELARAVREGRVESMARAAGQLAAYLLGEQAAIDEAMAEVHSSDEDAPGSVSAFAETEPPTAEETPLARRPRLTLPMIPDEFPSDGLMHGEDDFAEDDTDPVGETVLSDEPRTGVLGAPQTGIRASVLREACALCVGDPKTCPVHGEDARRDGEGEA